ncbi:MAG: TIM barrel protein [Bifidobacteriaceae bacterium]|jgi:hydroxypyruvate isomerase|nr:TIM barrel protein [Bifidobacteriaceae bacterium]
MFQLSACADMIFTSLPYLDRIAAIHDAGFGVEAWRPWECQPDGIVRLGIPIVSMQGYVHGGLATPEEGDRMVATARELIPLAHRLGCATLVIHGGELGEGGAVLTPRHQDTPQMWLAAVETLGRLAELGEREGVTYCLENLNRRVDHPGAPFATTDATRPLVSQVGSPALRMMLDLYHAQEDEGHLIETMRAVGPLIGEVQVADVPGRCEPGTGEARWEAVAAALDTAGYTGRVGLEAYAAGDPHTALDRFRAAFTPGAATSGATGAISNQ